MNPSPGIPHGSSRTMHKMPLPNGMYDRASAPIDPQLEQPVDPALTGDRNLAAEPGYADALKVWSRFRFVRAGWFTAQEAIEYID